MTATKLDMAAGGLLESEDEGELRIAIIHRDRYGDWTLPKGHLDPGETIEQAALREVEEETGCAGEIVEIVQPVSYLVKDQPKIVIFYRMRLALRGEFRPDDEVAELEWMTPADALQRLTYSGERSLVASVYSS